jgi:hypothetical protein
MQSTQSVTAHKFHVYPKLGTCAACGDVQSDNWLIREDWMWRLAPETLCPNCVAELRKRTPRRLQLLAS